MPSPAERRLTHDRGPIVVLEGRRHHLGGSGGRSIDQQHQRQFARSGRAPAPEQNRVGPGSPPHRHDRLALVQKPIRQRHRIGQRALDHPAKIDHHPVAPGRRYRVNHLANHRGTCAIDPVKPEAYDRAVRDDAQLGELRDRSSFDRHPERPRVALATKANPDRGPRVAVDQRRDGLRPLPLGRHPLDPQHGIPGTNAGGGPRRSRNERDHLDEILDPVQVHALDRRRPDPVQRGIGGRHDRRIRIL